MYEKKIVKSARKLAKEYLNKYGGCAQATFAAIADTLRLEGNKEIFKAMVGLSGGIGDLGTGSCGAITGAAAAVSLSLNIGRDELEQNKDLRKDAYNEVVKVGNKFKQKYGSFSCRDVQMQLFGKSFNLRDQQAYKEFQKVEEECKKVVEDATGWAVEVILGAKKIQCRGER